MLTFVRNCLVIGTSSYPIIKIIMTVYIPAGLLSSQVFINHIIEFFLDASIICPLLLQHYSVITRADPGGGRGGNPPHFAISVK